jgi:hypothetical protein
MVLRFQETMMEKIYAKNPDVVFRNIAGECILVPVKDNMRNLESIYALNDTGARVWGLVDGKRSSADIKESMTRDYDVSPDTAGRDVDEFLAALSSINAIQEAL